MARARKWARAIPSTRTGRGRRRYSDEERSDALVALQANGGNLKRTARELGVPLATLAGWSYGHVHPRVSDLRNEKSGPLADRLEELAHLLLSSMMRPEKLAAARFKDIAIAVGILIDKMVLLRSCNRTPLSR